MQCRRRWPTAPANAQHAIWCLPAAHDTAHAALPRVHTQLPEQPVAEKPGNGRGKLQTYMLCLLQSAMEEAVEQPAAELESDDGKGILKKHSCCCCFCCCCLLQGCRATCT